MSGTQTKFKKVIEFKNEQPCYAGSALKKMIDKAKAMDKEVFVICITGVSRSGKSFLLNLLQIYLEHYSKVNVNFAIRAKQFKRLKR